MPQADRGSHVAETAQVSASAQQLAQSAVPASTATPLDDAALDTVAAGGGDSVVPAPVQSPLVTVVDGVTGNKIRSFLPFGG